MAYFERTQILAADSPSIDAFSRWRVSNPTGLFDAQFTYNLNNLLFEQVTAGTGAAIAHDATNRMAVMTFASTPTGGQAYMQSYEYFRYQPGKSQLIFLTFNMIETAANCIKFAGYSDGANGIEFRLNGTAPQIAILSDTDKGDDIKAQADWNLDTMDGTGASGITLDFTKVQILVIDLQALYVGRVRVGFDVGGIVYYAHEFNHANVDTVPYIQTVNLPVRCGMTCSDTVSTTMDFICCSVISEGGSDSTAARTFGVEGDGTAGSGTRAHILSLRPKTTFNSLTNRTSFALDSVTVGNAGGRLVFWELVLGQAITGTTTYTDCNATYSAFEYNTAGTISGSPAIVIASGYVGQNSGASTATRTLLNRYPITLNAAGTAARALGTLSLIATGIGGTSAVRVTFNWAEIR
jgi:hypothetical protein